MSEHARRVIAKCGVALTIATAVLAASTQPGFGYACGSVHAYRGYDFAKGITNAKGVSAIIKIPASGTITGVSKSTAMSAGDVYLINGADFVQAGWYVGSTGTGLSYQTAPHFWYGEYNPSATGKENLHTSTALAWGSTHTVQISFTSTDGQYNFFLDGKFVAATARKHFTQGQAAFNGEIDFACVRMYTQASAAPAQSLRYATFGSAGTTWHWFSDLRGSNTNGSVTIFSVSGGTSASDFAYGGGS